MRSNDLWLYVSYFFLALFWLPAYFFIIRRGFKDRSYGMPIVAMLGNWPWEWMFGLNIYSACPLAWENCPQLFVQLANLAAALLDSLIVYTILRFGREQFKHKAHIYKYFYPLFIFGLVSSAAIQYTFIGEIGFPNVYGLAQNGQVPPFLAGDEGGSYSAYVLTFLMGILFILMLWERGNLEGQSFWIALTMTLGNVAAFVFLLLVGPASGLLWVLFILTVVVNVVYMVMTYQKSLELGFNPWTRF